MATVKTISADALSRVLSGLPGTPRVVASGNFATPMTLLEVLDKAVDQYQLFMLNAQRGIPNREGVGYETAFVGPGMRDNPRLSYYPCRLSRVPSLLKTKLPPDVVLLHASRPVGNAISLGVEINILPAAIEAARARGALVIAQVNPNMPATYGDALIALDLIDYIVEVDEPLTTHPRRDPDEISAGIGERVAALVPEQATLQLGIGAIPDATLGALIKARDLRIWSEMFSDGVLELEKAGCMDTDTPITASFCFGSAELYDWIDRNVRIQMLRTEKTNDPANIARRPAVISVNSALQIDLFGQANASRVGTRIYSGFGGQTDFVVGALHSPGGQAIIALRSWHAKSNNSSIVPMLSGPVTSFQHSFIVTENGAAQIWGNDCVTQAQELVDKAAHPDAREWLRASGRELGLPLT